MLVDLNGMCLLIIDIKIRQLDIDINDEDNTGTKHDKKKNMIKN